MSCDCFCTRLSYKCLYSVLIVATYPKMLTEGRQTHVPAQTPIDTGIVSSKSIPSPSVISRFEEIPDIRMATAKGNFVPRYDTNNQSKNQTATIKKGVLKLWERELVEAPEVKRKATVAQLCRCIVTSIA